MSGSALGAMKFMRTSLDGVWKCTEAEVRGTGSRRPRPRHPDLRLAPLLMAQRAGAGCGGGVVVWAGLRINAINAEATAG